MRRIIVLIFLVKFGFLEVTAQNTNSIQIGAGYLDFFNAGTNFQVYDQACVGVQLGVGPDLNLFNGSDWWSKSFPVQYWYGTGMLEFTYHFAGKPNISELTVKPWFSSLGILAFAEGENLRQLNKPDVAPFIRLGRELNLSDHSFFAVELGASYWHNALFFAVLPSGALSFHYRWGNTKK